MINKIKSKFVSIPTVALVALAIFGLMAGSAVASLTVVESNTTEAVVDEPIEGEWERELNGNGPFSPNDTFRARYDVDNNSASAPQYVAVKVSDVHGNLDDDSEWWIKNTAGCGRVKLGKWIVREMSSDSHADVEIDTVIPGDFNTQNKIGLETQIERVDDEYKGGDFPKCGWDTLPQE